MKEAPARIKINQVLEGAGWHFFADDDTPANIRLEPTVAISSNDISSPGENFEKATCGFAILSNGNQYVITSFPTPESVIVADHDPEQPSAIPAIEHYFKTYVTSGQIRDIIDQRQLTVLATNPVFSMGDFRAVPKNFRRSCRSMYSLNQFPA